MIAHDYIQYCFILMSLVILEYNIILQNFQL